MFTRYWVEKVSAFATHIMYIQSCQVTVFKHKILSLYINILKVVSRNGTLIQTNGTLLTP